MADGDAEDKADHLNSSTTPFPFFDHTAHKKLIIPTFHTTLHSNTHPQRLKSSLWYSIGSIVDAIALDQDLNATPQFIGSLTELVWSQILTSGADLENFAKHAGRDTIDTKDVLLLVRRNEQLKEVLENALKEIKK
ncbi:hypothetical protein D6D01_08280 [Aureobasidium pullulans]|uniref:Apoptosis-inducing TAF9-like domain 1 family protein n=1 Tax=Aureobasidium pullulans TaxID=5580 RepID=A0A4S9KFA8_AURPU|nr:hypothetical protein D6D01_08280 [Aureobasidium pullulans]